MTADPAEVLRLVETLSYTAVAERLGINKGAVAGIVFRNSRPDTVAETTDSAPIQTQTSKPSRWTQTAIAELRALAPKMSRAELATHFGMSKPGIVMALCRHCPDLTTKRTASKPSRWTQTAIAELRALAPKSTAAREHGMMHRMITDQLPVKPLPAERVDGRPAVLLPHQELTSRTCRWPFGDPRTSDFGFCGCRDGVLFPAQPYCDKHRAIAWAGR